MKDFLFITLYLLLHTELYNKSFRILFFDEMWEYEKTISELNEKLKTEKNTNAFNNLGVAHFEI